LDDSVGRELALIRVKADGVNRAQIIQIVEIFRANIVDVNDRSLMIEITGAEDKVEAMLQLLRPYGIMEIARTGKVAMVRGVKAQAG
ncbi:MAG: acetolactate synthase small subunit, partial [Syntrophothermus sp.]